MGFIDGDSPLGKSYQQHKHESRFYQEANFYNAEDIISSSKDAGFRIIRTVQTLFHPLAEITHVEPVKMAYGEGSFIVIKARK